TTEGGFAEVSGKQALGFDGSVNLAGGDGGAAGTLLLDPAAAVITNTASAANDTNLTSGNGNVSVPNSSTYSISYQAIHDTSATNDIVITATGNGSGDSITINDLAGGVANNVLDLQSAHSISFITDGTFSFANAANAITTAGGTISITAGTIGTLGILNAGSGTVTLDSTGSGNDVTLNSIMAHALNVTADGNILEASSAAIVVDGTTTL